MGPAEFVGLPPPWLLAEGLFAGLLASGVIVGVGAVGVWTGRSALASGEVGLVVSVALGVYLLITGAGRALVGMVAVLGACLALLTPQAVAGLVLAERGRVEPVVVTAVEGGPGTGTRHGRYLPSVASPEGVHLSTTIWRGCEESTRPGGPLAVVEGAGHPAAWPRRASGSAWPTCRAPWSPGVRSRSCASSGWPSPLWLPRPGLVLPPIEDEAGAVNRWLCHFDGDGDAPAVGLAVGAAVCTFRSGRGVRTTIGAPGWGTGGVACSLGSFGGLVCW